MFSSFIDVDQSVQRILVNVFILSLLISISTFCLSNLFNNLFHSDFYGMITHLSYGCNLSVR